MAKTFISASISTGNTIEAGHVTQSSDAFTGTEAYDIIISGSLTTTGTNIMSSSASPSITSILTDNDSHPFIQGATTTGPNFRMNLADANASGSAYMAFGRQTGVFGGTGFSTAYTTGSNASQGEIIMTLGKNGPLGSKLDRFIVQSEPGPIATNTDSELTLAVGSSTFSRRIVQGLVQNGTNDSAEFVAGNQDATPGYKKHVLMSFTFNNTSSVAGFASSSLNTGSTARNFNANSIPFGIVAGGLSTAELVDTAFFVDRGGSLGSILPVTASFEISRGGSINMEGHITASGNISASQNISAAKYQYGSKNLLSYTSANDTVFVNASLGNLFLAGNITASSTGQGNISASGDIVANNLSGTNTGDQDLSNLVTNSSTASFAITGSNVLFGNITSSGNISASGDLRADTLRVGVTNNNTNGLLISASTFNGDTRDAQIIYPNHGLHFNSDISNNHVLALAGNNVGIRKEPDDGNALQISGSISMVDGDIFGATNITASGNISASGHLVVDEILIPTFKLITPVDKAATGAPLIKTTGDIDNTNAIVSLGDPDAGDTGAHIRIEPGSEKVTFQGLDTTITGSIITTAAGTFQGGKPITTHTTSPISSSLPNAGKYHIVGGTLTSSIVLDSAAPIGAEYEFFQTSSTGQFLFESASGTTVISKNGSLRLAQQGSSAVLKKVATDTFHLLGDLT